MKFFEDHAAAELPTSNFRESHTTSILPGLCREEGESLGVDVYIDG
jgi:hypothetical protein